MKKSQDLDSISPMCVCKETVTLPSSTPYQATKELRGLSLLMLSVGMTGKVRKVQQSHTYNHLCANMMLDTHTNTHTALIENTPLHLLIKKQKNSRGWWIDMDFQIYVLMYLHIYFFFSIHV